MTIRGSSRGLSTFAAVFAIVLAVLAPPAAATTTSVDCDSDPGALQPAIDTAGPGETLEITGTCVGNFTIETGITLEGTGTLDGNGAGTVLWVGGSGATIVDLTVTNGNGSPGGGIYVDFFSIVELRGSASVSGNTATAGGGIYSAGDVVMRDSSSVSGNTADVGGGIYDRHWVVMRDSSSVTGNTADVGGGVFVLIFRDLHLSGSASISGNRAITGGGIAAQIHATVSLNEGASLNGNQATRAGGGFHGDSFLILRGSSSVNGNRAGTVTEGGRGGGIWTALSVDLNDRSKVHGNRATGPGADGGGIYFCGAFMHPGSGVNQNGGTVKGNKPNNISLISEGCA